MSTTVTVTPEKFELVEFDAAEIQSLAEEMVASVGLPDGTEVVVDVDEVSMMAHVDSVIEGSKVNLKVTGGAFEDQRKARTLSPERTRLVLGTYLVRAKDRLDPSWADAPANDALTVQQSSAWDTYTEGRLARIGLPARPARRIYHFRLRHGFSDGVDAVFHRLWDADGLSWADIEAACAETASCNARGASTSASA